MHPVSIKTEDHHGKANSPEEIAVREPDRRLNDAGELDALSHAQLADFIERLQTFRQAEARLARLLEETTRETSAEFNIALSSDVGQRLTCKPPLKRSLPR